MKFSQRISKTPIRESLQIASIDDDLRNGLWNLVFAVYLEHLEYWVRDCSGEEKLFFRLMWHEFFKYPLDSLAERTDDN